MRKKRVKALKAIAMASMDGTSISLMRKARKEYIRRNSYRPNEPLPKGKSTYKTQWAPLGKSFSPVVKIVYDFKLKILTKVVVPGSRFRQFKIK